MAFATVEEYEDRYKEVSDTDMLQECLEDCSALIEVELERYGVDYSDPSEKLADRLMRACRQMAHRVMPRGGDADVPVGATQMSRTAGPYSEQFTLATTYDTPKVTDEERKLLGIYGARIGFGALAGRDD